MRQLRQERGLTQYQLAALVQVREQAVREWELHGAVPGLDKAVLLARALSISVDELAALLGLTADTKTEGDESNGQINLFEVSPV